MPAAPQPSPIRWASRWDTYLTMADDHIHWFSIVNSLMIVLFLSGMVAMIMMRTLHRDISQYNQLETAEEAQEETGWKLVRCWWCTVLAGSCRAVDVDVPWPKCHLAWLEAAEVGREMCCKLVHLAHPSWTCRLFETGWAAHGPGDGRSGASASECTSASRRCTATCSGRPRGRGCCRCMWARGCSSSAWRW